MKSQGVFRAFRANSGAVAAALALSPVVLLAGCGDSAERASTGPNIVQPGAPGEGSRTLSEEELAELEPTPFVAADVEFMQGMIHHHAQALRMTALVPARAVGKQLPLLAERMEISQQSEIEQMQQWLEAHKQPVPELGPPHGHVHPAGEALTPGMLTEPELVRLERADGRPFEQLFLRSMIRHHLGALTMVRRLYAAGGGAEPDADSFARHVEADQRIELDRMRGLLAERT